MRNGLPYANTNLPISHPLPLPALPPWDSLLSSAYCIPFPDACAQYTLSCSTPQFMFLWGCGKPQLHLLVSTLSCTGGLVMETD